jgi:hypothetical protein
MALESRITKFQRQIKEESDKDIKTIFEFGSNNIHFQ